MITNFEHELIKVSQKFRQIRQSAGMRLSDLAEKTGYSTAMLSKIENHRTTPSLQTMLALSTALGVPLSDIFEGISAKPQDCVKVVRATERVPLEKEASTGFTYELISSLGLSDYKMCEINYLTLVKNAKREKVVTDGRELVHVIEGRIEYAIDDDIFLLDTGDTIEFDGTLEHVPLCISDEAKLLAIYFLV